MKTKELVFVSVLLLVIMVAASAFAAAPVIKEIPYSKTVALSDGEYTFRFSLYDASAGGTGVWYEETNETVSSGQLKHTLGSVVSLDSSSFLDNQLWVQVERLNGMVWEVVGIRDQMMVVPYALWSDTTTSAGDITKVTAGTGLTGGGDSGDVTLNANIGTGANQVAAGNHTHDSAYVNATGDTMTGSLSINQAGTGNAGYFRITNAANSNIALRGETGGTGYAVQGYTTGTGRAGHFEINNTGNSAAALYAKTNGPGYAIQGFAYGTGKAGHFEINNTGNTATALHSRTNGSGMAFHAFTTGTNRAAMFEINNPSSSAAAVYAKTNGTGYAGHFQGNVNVTGSVTGASFTGDGTGLTNVTPKTHNHSGSEITSGTVGEAYVDASIARDAEVTSSISAHTSNASAHHTRYTDGEAVAAIKAADGTGSGLDADLLDGAHASSFAQISHDHNTDYVNTSGDTMTGALNLPANGLVAGTNQLVLSGGNVGIGTNSPTEQLEITGNLKLPVTSASTGIIKSGADIFIHNYGTNNFFSGKNAGNLTMTGSGNTGVGVAAGAFNTTGYNNTFIGMSAGRLNTSGYENTFLGHNAGDNNTTGYKNTFIGKSAGLYNTNGHDNAFLGYSSGYSNSTGNDNTFLGSSAGVSNTTGYSNTFLGMSAGYSNTTGYYNTFLGRSAGSANTTGAANTFIGNATGALNTTGSYNTMIGETAGAYNTTGYGNTFLGRAAGNANTTGAANTFTGESAGYSNTTGSYNTMIGQYAGYYNTTGYENTFLGREAGMSNTTGYYNTFLGRGAGISNTTGYYNTFLGRYAGSSNTTGAANTFIGNDTGAFNTTGSYNTMIGETAGYYNTTGYENTFLGDSSGFYNTTGYYNTFLGRSAGYSNTTGNFNTFLGRSAGISNTTGGNNTFLGLDAGYNNTTGSSNTFIGFFTGYGNTTGYVNTFLGDSAGYTNTTGYYNTFIGNFAGYYNTAGYGNVFIGKQAGFYETGSNKLYIDNSNTSTPLIYGDFSANSVTINGNFNATGTKSFIQPHAKDPSKEIVYIATEAPEAVVIHRGTARLMEGIAVIELPDYFSVVASENGIQVQVTPAEDCNGIFVKSQSKDRIEVKELLKGSSNAKFNYLVTAVRAGFEEHEPVVSNINFRPGANEKSEDFEARYTGDDMNSKAIRSMLVSNGLLDGNGKLNIRVAKALGWINENADMALSRE